MFTILLSGCFSLVIGFSLYVAYLFANLYYFGRHPRNIFTDPIYNLSSMTRSCSEEEKNSSKDHAKKKKSKFNKNPFKKENLAQDYDIIIIGSGISGLSCGSVLSKAGKKVLILEQHKIAGGCLHTFNLTGENGEKFQFCAGLHYMGKLQGAEGALLDALCEKHIEMKSLDSNFDRVHVMNTATNETLLDLEIPAGVDSYEKKLKEAFPDEIDAIDKYVKILKDHYEIVPVFILKSLPYFFSFLKYLIAPTFMKYVHLSVAQLAKSLTSNKVLQAVWCYICVDYASSPKRTPVYEHLAVKNLFVNGAQIPLHGANDIVESLIQVIRKGSGDIFTNAKVHSLYVKDGRVQGVEMVKDHLVIKAPIVISTVGAFNTFQKLLPVSARESFGYSNIHYTPAFSSQVVFLGFNKSIEELGIKHQNTFIVTNPDIDAQHDRFMNSNGILDPMNGIDHPVVIANFRSVGNKVSAILLTFSKYEWFSDWEHQRVTNRSVDYEDLKQGLSNRAVELFYEKFPQLRDSQCVLNSCSPVTFNHYLGCNFGEWSGWKRIVGDDSMIFKWGRPKSNIEGLYLAGQDVFAGGVQGSILTCLTTCGSILHRNLYGDLQEFYEKTLKNNKP
ncbi:hypothetical protein C9374_005737 [Naegleria lovaniensis]|uniref:All-trans-retinol 13,14-reductase n=1 Tax=Naegleria lovaniensis TaxID=51637 RepID=A0AA88GPZ6_NAELO|nr:uncharacterized protein C9374_005737 [Naegleria lovaniensis]KAG2381945.1 hypothetical protein C9374_005737 [Naegleria lovaniensis]